jgi:tellurite resistance protein
MGLAGLSVSLGLAARTWGLPLWIDKTIGMIAIVLFLVLAVAYLIKIKRYPRLVKREFNHPVSVSFFATIPISLLQIPGILRQYDLLLAEWVWGIAAVLMFLFAWMAMRKWLDSRQDPGNALPAWVLPVAGSLNVPIVGGYFPIRGVNEICLLFYGIGILFAIILTTIIISRLFFQPAMPAEVQPTLLILVATFALAFSDHVGLTGRKDIFASVLFYFDLFLLLLFGSKIFLLPRCCPFRVSWWSVSFPLTAVTIAAFHYAEFNDAWLFKTIAGTLVTISTFVILYLLIQTFSKISKGDLFLDDAAAEKATEQQLHEPVAEGK